MIQLIAAIALMFVVVLAAGIWGKRKQNELQRNEPAGSARGGRS